jgi:hypothetical protein
MSASQQLAAFNYRVPGALTWVPVQSTSFNAIAGNAYPVNTTSSAITVTLPASPSAGNVVQLTDYAGTWGTNNITVVGNGSKIDGSTVPVALSTNRESIAFVYVDSTQGWIPYSGFNTSTPSGNYSALYLIVAGGGGGAGDNAGGGGAGGLLSGTAALTSGTNYPVVIGAGGSSGSSARPSTGMTAGANSTFYSLTAVGGGTSTGFTGGATTGGSGGSGGGAGAPAPSSASTGGTATSGQGNAGGSGATNSSYYVGGGGGGAGAAGGNGASSGPNGAPGGNGNTSARGVFGSARPPPTSKRTTHPRPKPRQHREHHDRAPAPSVTSYFGKSGVSIGKRGGQGTASPASLRTATTAQKVPAEPAM